MASEGEAGERRVLIVEDEPTIAETLADLLSDEGYVPTIGVDGAALAVAHAEPPALILLDAMMPGLDGAEVCRRLKADPRAAARNVGRPAGRLPARRRPAQAIHPSRRARCRAAPPRLRPMLATSPAPAP